MKILQKYKKEEYKYYISIILLALLICAPLTVKGWIDTHDGHAHLARNYQTIEAFSQGQIPITVVSNFCKGFGYSWNTFYPPLSTYIGAIFKLFVPTYMATYKITIVVAVIIASLAMFRFIKKMTENIHTAFITSIIYISSLYFLTNIYIRRSNGRNYGIYVFSYIIKWTI